jgi:hypothetical protein
MARLWHVNFAVPRVQCSQNEGEKGSQKTIRQVQKPLQLVKKWLNVALFSIKISFFFGKYFVF